MLQLPTFPSHANTLLPGRPIPAAPVVTSYGRGWLGSAPGWWFL